MTIKVLEIKNAADDALEVTLRGDAAKIIAVLVNGLPYEDLVQIGDALTVEIHKRNAEATSPHDAGDRPSQANPKELHGDEDA